MLHARWLGRVRYEEALWLQRAVARRSASDYLLLMEHPHVYTTGRHGAPSNVLVGVSELEGGLLRVDRGGDVTYHGPGQLVGYPIVQVGRDYGVADHTANIEQLVIRVLGRLGIDAQRRAGLHGVWVAGSAPRKICSVGTRLQRGRTLHGFALNVSTDLVRFEPIMPCGIEGVEMTSVRSEGSQASMAEIVSAVSEEAGGIWGCGGVDFASVGWPLTQSGGTANEGERRSHDRSRSGGMAKGRSGEAPLLPRSLSAEALGPVAAHDVSPVQGRIPLAAPVSRKPPWMRPKASMGPAFAGLKAHLSGSGIVTVCEEAGCPNIFECYSAGTATFMMNGDRCTRNCGFCLVDTRRPLAQDPDEPSRVARAVRAMGLGHVVVTTVARDDLVDGGAGAMAEVVKQVRLVAPRAVVELLISDLKGDRRALDTVFAALPDVLNHNLETVARLQRAVRPQAGYARSLAVLARAAQAGLVVKSGLMVGLGETYGELMQAMEDIRAAGATMLTVGQYLRPSRSKVAVVRWWEPEEFGHIASAGYGMGFSHVAAAPLARSSYHAREGYAARGSSSTSEVS